MTRRVAIVGVTGNVGSRLAPRLVDNGTQVRGICRNPDRFEGPDAVELVAADATDVGALSKAFDGVEAVYFTPSIYGDRPNAVQAAQTAAVVEAAKHAGVDHIVAHTAMHSDRGDTGAELLDAKLGIDKALADSGIGYTVLRPAYFLQNFWGAKQYMDQGHLSLPVPAERRIGMVSANDIAVAAAGVIEAGPQNRGFDLHMPGGTTCTEVAECASRASGNEVKFHTFDGDLNDYVAGFPISDAHKQLYIGLFEYFRKGDYLGSPGDIQDVVPGFEYGTVDQFMQDEMYAGATASAAPA